MMNLSFVPRSLLGRFLPMPVAVAMLGCGNGMVGATENTDAAPELVDEPAEPMLVLPAEFVQDNEPLRMLSDGDDVQLLRPPQGGHILTISAKVKNLTSDAVTLRVRARKLAGGLIIAEEARTVAMLDIPNEPGFRQPNLTTKSQAAQVPVCPDYDPSDVVDQEMLLEVEIVTQYTARPLEAVGVRRVVARCSQTDPNDRALCRCECEKNYVLGRCGGQAGNAGFDAGPFR